MNNSAKVEHKETDLRLMNLAIKESKKALNLGEVPVGCIIADSYGKVVSSGYNMTITNNDPTAHAEIVAIRNAALSLSNYRLNNLSLYVTLEPCAMCIGAIVQARIKKIIFSAYDEKTGMCGSCMNILQGNCFNHFPEIIGGILQNKSSTILSSFFKSKRN